MNKMWRFFRWGFNCLDGTFHSGARNVIQAVLDVTPGIGSRAMEEELLIARGTWKNSPPFFCSPKQRKLNF
jgi:hypothetical protein